MILPISNWSNISLCTLHNAHALNLSSDIVLRRYVFIRLNGILENEFAVGFMSPKWIHALHQGENRTLIQADATFYVVPNQFSQLLNIFLQYKSYSLPAIHILMTKKTGTLYDQVVGKIKEIIPLCATGIITDFEHALFNSFSSGFPNARVSGCKFHHDQAFYRTAIQKNGLTNLYASHHEFRKWAGLFMCLPLLPSGKIVEMYDYLKLVKPELPQSEDDKVTKLLRYYKRFWLEQIGPSRLSVFQNEKRTTNDLESFHANLKRKFKSHNPNYWNFITNLNKIITTTEKDMERIDNNLPIRRNSRPIVRRKNLIIENLQRKLINGEINSVEYLEIICHQYKTNFMNLEGTDPSDNEDEIDRILDAEDLNESISGAESVVSNRVCLVCLVREPDTLIIPCRHAQTCYSCTERIANSDELNTCPVCRGQIEQFLQIFL